MRNRTNVMKKGVVVCCVALMGIGATIAVAQAKGCDEGPGGRPGHHDFKKIAKKLGLSDDQKAKAKVLFTANREIVKPIFDTLHGERKNLQTLLHADAVDEAAIRAATARVAALEADLNVNRAKTGVQFRALLTPAQRELLTTMEKERHKMGDHDRPPRPEHEDF